MSSTTPEGRGPDWLAVAENNVPGWTALSGPRALRGLAFAAVLLYVAAVALRPLNANDLFWHLASGREILASRSIPRADPFSFAGDGGPWVDHEWLWQAAAHGVYATAAGGRGPTPDAKGGYALILFGVLTVLAAFCIALWALAREDLPAGAIAALGLVAAEVARERMMVRPETASLLFLAVFLYLLGRGEPGLRRGVRLALVAAVWANVHPAALLAPVLVLLHGLGSDGRDRGTRGPWRERLGVLLEALLAGLGTLVNPFGAALWTVPFKLSTLVRTQAFFNPEWLRPPLARFPLFYVAVLAAGLLPWSNQSVR